MFWWLLSPFLVSCQGKSPSSHSNSGLERVFVGDTVDVLSTELDVLLQDRKGVLWIGSNGHGLFRFDGKALTQFKESHGLCSRFVLNVKEDLSGVLWITTRDGVCTWDGKRFLNYTSTIKNAPYGKWIYKPGGMFFNHLDGICFFDGKTFTNFKIQPDSYSPPPYNYSRPYTMYSYVADRTGTVWFGTESGGVCSFNGSTLGPVLTEKNLAGFAVRAMFQDRRGDLWFGNNGAGLFRYDGKVLTNITEERGLGNPEFLKGHPHSKPGSLARVFSITDDPKGNLWIGTIDAGIWKWEGGKLTEFNKNHGLDSLAIVHIYRTPKDEILAICGGRSVVRFNGKGFEKLTFQPGKERD